MKNFWNETPSRNPPLTDAMIAHAEKVLGVKFPTRYIELLREKNGGYTASWVYPTSAKTSWADSFVPLESLAGIGNDGSPDDADNVLVGVPLAQEEWGVPAKQVPLCGDGHWWITLDYRAGEEPTVSWIDTEVDEDLILAATFADFINKLLPESCIDPDTDELILPDPVSMDE